MAVSPILGNRYKIIEQLGTGGMAEVYQARDLMLERPVAVKVLRSDYSTEPGFQESFRHEARAAANLSHPNIVTIHDFGFDGGQLYIVMEFIPGMTLKEMIQTRGRFTPEEAIPLMVQACAGIGYAHRAGLVHCDVKPHNMLVTPDLRLKVADFGIARALAGIQPEEKADTVWGSPLYFSPEQAAGFPPTPASDVYSLGVTFYEMLTGQTPFMSNRAETLAEMHRELTPRPPSLFNPAVPPGLEQIVMKTLSKEPSARYRTADQLGRVLLNFGGPTAPLRAINPDTTPTGGVNRDVAGQRSFATRWMDDSGDNSQPVMVVESPSHALPESQEMDWTAVLLGLTAVALVLGLIPFYIFVFGLYAR
jgi:eukaryotic-like serine/threonine-protein kinase